MILFQWSLKAPSSLPLKTPSNEISVIFLVKELLLPQSLSSLAHRSVSCQSDVLAAQRGEQDKFSLA